MLFSKTRKPSTLLHGIPIALCSLGENAVDSFIHLRKGSVNVLVVKQMEQHGETPKNEGQGWAVPPGESVASVFRAHTVFFSVRSCALGATNKLNPRHHDTSTLLP